MSSTEKKKSQSGPIALIVKLAPKLLKGLKFLKFGLGAATFASYSLVYTWKFAILIMVAIGWHESGHVWAMKHKGLKTKGFYFLPFIGGAAIQEEMHKTYWDSVFISIMGPVFGLGLAAATYLGYLATGWSMLAAATCWMAVVNLFNLLPMSPLDGGHLVKAIAFSFSTWLGKAFTLLSFVVGVIFAYKLGIGLFVFFLIVGGLDMVFEFIIRKNKPRSDYPEAMNGKQIAMTFGWYGLTLVALFALVFATEHVSGADIAANFLRD